MHGADVAVASASSTPSAVPRAWSVIRVIEKPPSCSARMTSAVVSTCPGAWPACSMRLARDIEKQPAWAAPISSSGFVCGVSSTRERSENGTSSAPLRPLILPPPFGTVPSQRAVARRLMFMAATS
jgi:hypothetical protein